MINVTKPFLPKKEEYQQYVDEIWNRNWLTNNGPLVNELEFRLKEYLGLNQLLYVSNGTIALQIAIKALGLAGEIITTPFSYVATVSSIVWENCQPIFVDIDGESLNIDATKIEEAITSETSAILATHVYGNPCDIETIEAVAEKHQLKVIYDAAHCFGTTYKGKSVFEFGDISTASFHATKVFHTIEGGAVITKDEQLIEKMGFLRNFGHNGVDEFTGVGINGKNSEFHAAMGLANLNYIDAILAKRQTDSEQYHTRLNTRVNYPKLNKDASFNYSYFPVLFQSEEECLQVLKCLENEKIFPRRYFYPSLSSLKYVKKQHTPISDEIAKRVLCLPLYYELTSSEIDMVCRIIIRTLSS